MHASERGWRSVMLGMWGHPLDAGYSGHSI